MILLRRPLLTDVQKSVYDEMVTYLWDRRLEFKFKTRCTGEDVLAAYKAVHFDHFELFWLGFDGAATDHPHDRRKKTSFSINSLVPEGEIDHWQQVIDQNVKGFLATVPAGATTYEKVLLAYEHVIDRTTYDPEARFRNNALGVFADGRAVCSGYSEAFAYLLSAMGIPCACVTGATDGSEEANHEWNVVEIDGFATHVDVTMGDPSFRLEDGSHEERLTHAYFGLSDAEIRKTRTVDEGQLVPSCTTKAFDWYGKRGRLVATFSAQRIEHILCDAVRRGERECEFKCASPAAFEGAKAYVQSTKIFGGPFWEAASSFCKARGEAIEEITYYDYPAVRVIVLQW